jgi:hypothetical protein
MRRPVVSAVLVALGAVLTPAAALACPTCVSSAFGDRTYNWAYLGLLVMPFVLTAVVGAIVAWSAGARLRLPAWRAASLFSGRAGKTPPAGASGTPLKETT